MKIMGANYFSLPLHRSKQHFPNESVMVLSKYFALVILFCRRIQCLMNNSLRAEHAKKNVLKYHEELYEYRKYQFSFVLLQ